MLLIQSCGEEKYPSKKTRFKSGAELYQRHCTLCHGNEGNAGIGGAKKLGSTLLTKGEQISIISKGKNNMQGFGEKLTPSEIERIVEFIETLKK